MMRASIAILLLSTAVLGSAAAWQSGALEDRANNRPGFNPAAQRAIDFPLGLAARSRALFASEAAMNDADAAKLIAAGRSYADRYISNLPNFICEQVTEQFQAGRKPEHWRKLDTLTAKLVFSKGREQRTLELVNDKPLRPGMRRVRTPMRTEGEFGDLINNVFNAVDDTGFHFSRWESVGGTRAAVFEYSVDLAHSTLSLTDFVRATVPYRGTISLNPANGEILHIGDFATEIPAAIRIRRISTDIDYQIVDISGAKYLLPAHATVMVDSGTENIRNEITFQKYRKFEVESSITFGSESEPAKPAPLPPTPPRN